MNMRLALMFLLVGTLFFSHAGKAQKLFFVYANGMYNTPTGKFKESQYNYGLGGEAGAGFGLLSSTFITGSIGYNTFHNKVDGVSNLKVTPIKFGLRHYLFAKMLFVKADAGVAAIKGDGDSKSKFTMGAGAGVKFAGLNLGIDYNTVNTGISGANWYGWFAFKAGFSIGI
ncbi:hypothetical protein SAMN05421788_11249 [Filimonas lacunae]|uniref:Outer membrane protein beta-barrel domain-containing protein n=1 Tax=Filimonas lacunae TaxID=477680 RepID=A0A173MLA0_9BACT|nr:porin family protein [Filimonas lacunae]BAV08246.1 hypothetical protein FLA_4279 [Filimonas lacunae]SIT33157.1 hypothetical protein SAMN05421788_11249 [Filimonas lacunae]